MSYSLEGCREVLVSISHEAIEPLGGYMTGSLTEAVLAIRPGRPWPTQTRAWPTQTKFCPTYTTPIG